MFLDLSLATAAEAEQWAREFSSLPKVTSGELSAARFFLFL